MSLRPGTRVGPYEIVSPIGAGGMGEVYLAQDTRLDRRVALKVLPAAEAGDDKSRQRLMQEAKAAARLDHPHICTVYDVGEADGRLFIAMQLVEGETLDRRLRRGPLPLPTVVDLARQIAEALAAAHARGVVHRDIKPQNVMVTPKNQVRVLDFGLAQTTSDEPIADAETAARLTDTGVVAGTVPYMSPEQLRGEAVDARSDIFSFGTMLYEMVGRVHPFSGPSRADTASAVLTRDPAVNDLSAPPELRRIIRKCLEKDRERRYQSTRDLAVDLDHFSHEDVTPVVAAAPKRRAPTPVVAIAAVAAIAAAIASTAVWYLRTPAKTAPTTPAIVQLTDFADSATAPSLSPDGHMVAFIRGGPYFLSTGQIYVKTLPNGEPIQLTNDPRPKYAATFSPDGRRIAFTIVDIAANSWDTWTVPVTGGVAPTRLLPNASGLAWVDDEHVVFSEIQAGSALHMGLVTSTESRGNARAIYLPPHERAMAHFAYPSPDRQWLLVVEMNGSGVFDSCRLVPFDGSSGGRPVGPRGACRLGAWSPDGRWMFFTAYVNGAQHLWRQKFPDGTPELLTTTPTGEEEGVAIAPGGGSLVTAIGRQRITLWIHTPSGEQLLSPEGDAYSARLSRDGARMYFLWRKSPDHPQELTRMVLASRQTERLVPDHEINDFDVSADESAVVFTTTGADRQPEVWIAALDRRTAPRKLAQGNRASFGARHDVVFRFADGPSSFIERIAQDGTGRERVTKVPVIDVGDVSSDGQWIVASQRAGDSSEVRVIPVYGGTSKLLCTLCAARWSKDGRLLYFTTVGERTANQTFVVPLRVGEAVPAIADPRAPAVLQWQKRPDVRAIGRDFVVAGPDPSVYVYSVLTELRNLFRVPIS